MKCNVHHRFKSFVGIHSDYQHQSIGRSGLMKHFIYSTHTSTKTDKHADTGNTDTQTSRYTDKQIHRQTQSSRHTVKQTHLTVST